VPATDVTLVSITSSGRRRATVETGRRQLAAGVSIQFHVVKRGAQDADELTAFLSSSSFEQTLAQHLTAEGLTVLPSQLSLDRTSITTVSAAGRFTT
jgi:hypothetical protein